MIDWKSEWKPLALIVCAFLACFFLPIGTPRFDNAVGEALHLTKWYAREHVLLCLVPAFFIAGAISVFVSQASVMKYLGARAHKVVAYGVAALVMAALLAWPLLPADGVGALHEFKPLIIFALGAVGLGVIAATQEGESGEWFGASWSLTKQILPLLLGGVLVSGLLLGRPEKEGWIPSAWIQEMVGGNSLGANLFSSVFGAFMYFATLTEVPILQGLLGSGMGKGSALALLLSGPALSLPSMIVIHSLMGLKKTVVFVSLVIVLSMITGWFYGAVWG